MTVTISLANSNDGYIYTADLAVNNAVNGASPTVVTGTTTGIYGLEYDAGIYAANETFLEFAYTVPSNEVITAATFALRHASHSSGAPVEAQMWTKAWGGTIDSGDWFNPLSIFTSTRVFRVVSADLSGTSQDVCAGQHGLVSHLRSTASPYRFVLASNRQLVYDTPVTADETQTVWLAESSLDPALIVTSAPVSTLHGVLGAQVQLSDGTWVVLESDGATVPTILLRHVTAAGVATTKATIPTAESAGNLAVQVDRGAQQLGLVVDSSDNLYVLGREGNTENSLALKAYTKGVGYTWTAQASISAAFPSWDNHLNNFAGAWHSVGSGTLVVFASRMSSDGYHGVTGYEGAWLILNAASALAGTGWGLVRASGSMVGQFTPALSPYVWCTPMNDTGSGMDVTALTSTKGALHTWSRTGQLGRDTQTTKARYTLNSTGTGFESSFTDTPTGSSGTWGVKTGSSKLRVVPISADTVAVVSADSASTWGLTVAVLRNAGSATSWTLLGRVRLSNESISTMPTEATLSQSHAWDAAYVSGPNKLWVYYFDVANGRRLMRTAVSLNTYTATREQVEVNAAVGASGSTNLAVRVARGSSTPRRTLLAVANRSSGGVHSTTYLVDTPNEPPTGPTLAPRANFDAANPAAFSWTFNDPDVDDAQSAFELDINSASGVDQYDTGQLGAAITYVGIGAKAEADAANLTPALPAGWVPGDLLVVFAVTRDTADTVDVPAGWATLRAVGTNFKVLGRIARTGDVAPTITFTGDAAGDTNIAQCAAWRGTDQDVATVVAHAADQTNASAANVAYPALTITTAGCAVVVAAEKQDDWTSVAALAGMTEIADSPSVLGNDAALAVDYVIQTTATNISSGSFTVTGGASAVSKATVLALRPYQAPTASNFTLPASTLPQPGAWQWRARTWDTAGASGAWSSYATFSTGVGGTVTVTDPVADNPAGFNVNSYPVVWSLTGAVQADYRVNVYRTDTSALVYASGWVTSTNTTHTVTGLLSDVEQRIEVTTRTAVAVESNVGTRLVTPSYATPDIPTVTAVTMPDDGHTLVQVTNPGPSGSRPAVSYTQILRSVVTGPGAGDDPTVIGAVDPDGSWKDYTAASHVTYSYTARSVAADGHTTDSAPVEATLILQGVWIHDPADPANADDSAHHYPYGISGRGLDVDVVAEGKTYAGRAYPVFDFGENQAQTFTFNAQVPYGDTWLDDLTALRAFVDARATIHIRDARGRHVFGVLPSVSESDETWGTAVSGTVTTVDYDETFVGAP